MRITASQLQEATNMSDESVRLWLAPFNEAGQDCGLTTPARWAMWLAQCGHESSDFTRLAESMDYSPERMLVIFKGRVTPEFAYANGRTAKHPANQKAIANEVYGGHTKVGKELGNRPGTDDGWRYRGGGVIQLTGYGNWLEAGEHLGLDLIEDPEILRTNRRYAAKSTAYFWDTRRVNRFADEGDVRGATKVINGGYTDVDKRVARYNKALAALGGSAAAELARLVGLKG